MYSGKIAVPPGGGGIVQLKIAFMNLLSNEKAMFIVIILTTLGGILIMICSTLFVINVINFVKRLITVPSYQIIKANGGGCR
jgi:hypothetical protein